MTGLTATLDLSPLRGHSAEALTTVNSVVGETLLFDRVLAIENGPGRVDPPTMDARRA
jgi:hypothetical protein